MTEQEWMECTDPQKMLEFLGGKGSDRKLRLFAVACCRRIWHLMTDKRSRKAVEVGERYADKLATPLELHNSWSLAKPVVHDIPKHNPFAAQAAFQCCYRSSVFDAKEISEAVASAVRWSSSSVPANHISMVRALALIKVTELLREIFGNPFGPVTTDPLWLAWNDGVVQKIAQAIYDARAFDRLPILADALEEGGCTNAEILAHCRSGGEHVRGCWVVDLLLGKS